MANVIYVDGCSCENCKPLDPKKRLRWKNCTYLSFKISDIGTGLGAILFLSEQSLPELTGVIEQEKPQEILVAMNRDCAFLMREKPGLDEDGRIREVERILLETIKIIRTRVRRLKIVAVCWAGNQNLHLKVDFPS
jgi:hypothetical protein